MWRLQYHSPHVIARRVIFKIMGNLEGKEEKPTRLPFLIDMISILQQLV